MRTADIYVSDRCQYDSSIQHPISLRTLHSTFCFKLSSINKHVSGADLYADCIHAPHVDLFTFVGEERLDDTIGVVWDEVAELYLQFLHQKSADTSGVRMCSGKSNGVSIANHVDLRNSIISSCQEQWERNYAHFIREASYIERDKHKYNTVCGKLLQNLIVLAPIRFRAFKYEHTYSIPFLPGDRIHFGCVIKSYHGTQAYDIRLVVSR